MLEHRYISDGGFFHETDKNCKTEAATTKQCAHGGHPCPLVQASRQKPFNHGCRWRRTFVGALVGGIFLYRSQCTHSPLCPGWRRTDRIHRRHCRGSHSRTFGTDLRTFERLPSFGLDVDSFSVFRRSRCGVFHGRFLPFARSDPPAFDCGCISGIAKKPAKKGSKITKIGAIGKILLHPFSLCSQIFTISS